jgi:hypothetical protein
VSRCFSYLCISSSLHHVLISAVSYVCYITLQDFIVKATLNLKCLKFRVLDEADEMLNMGFVDDVELILGMLICQFLCILHSYTNFFFDNID